MTGTQAQIDLGNWFIKLLAELDKDELSDSAALEDLKQRVVTAFVEWRMATSNEAGLRERPRH